MYTHPRLPQHSLCNFTSDIVNHLSIQNVSLKSPAKGAYWFTWLKNTLAIQKLFFIKGNKAAAWEDVRCIWILLECSLLHFPVYFAFILSHSKCNSQRLWRHLRILISLKKISQPIGKDTLKALERSLDGG